MDTVLTKKLIDFCEKIYDDTQIVNTTRRFSNYVKDVSFFQLVRGRSLLRSVTILNQNMQYPDVPILVRILLETYIQFSWLLHLEPEMKCKRYANLSHAIRIRAFLKTKPDPQDLSNCDEEYRAKCQEATRIVSEYGYKEIMDVKKWQPFSSKKKPYTLQQMAYETELKYDYDVTYNWLSEVCHGGPGSEANYYIVNGSGLAPRTTGTEIHLKLAIDYFLKIWALANKGMGANYRDAIFARLEFDQITNNCLKPIIVKNRRS